MRNLFPSLAAGLVITAGLLAQCQPSPLWSIDTLGPPLSASTLLTHSTGDLYVAGAFTSFGGTAANGIAVRRAGVWQALGSGITGSISCLAELQNGAVIAAGSLSAAGGSPVANIAQWDGISWSPLGTGLDGQVTVAKVAGNGDLIVGGQFSQAGGTPAPFLARWNGSSWSGLAGGPSAGVTALAIGGNGDVLADGFANGIARWNGSSWQPLGSASNVSSLFVRTNGDVLAGFSNSVQRWNGTAWTTELFLSGGQSRALGMLELPTGELLVFGWFQTLAAPGMPIPIGARGIGVLRGTSWSGNGSVLGMPGWTRFHSIRSAGVDTAGGVLLAGWLPTAAGTSVAIQRVTTSCPAAVLDLGGGCMGPGGSNLLTARTLPWLGTTFRADASQLPAPALAATVFGFSTMQVPLLSIFPTALPGCDLRVTPDLFATPFAPTGSASMAIDLPPSLALAGAQLFAQVVAIQLDAAGAFLAVTGTNALRATLGAN